MLQYLQDLKRPGGKRSDPKNPKRQKGKRKNQRKRKREKQILITLYITIAAMIHNI